jgi:hypothetical protein
VKVGVSSNSICPSGAGELQKRQGTRHVHAYEHTRIRTRKSSFSTLPLFLGARPAIWLVLPNWFAAESRPDCV